MQLASAERAFLLDVPALCGDPAHAQALTKCSYCSLCSHSKYAITYRDQARASPFGTSSHVYLLTST